MSEWLDLMLDEVARKRREREEAMAELERRNAEAATPPTAEDAPAKVDDKVADKAGDKAADNTAQSEPSAEGK